MLSLLKQTFSEFSSDKCTRMAAALAYYVVFALPPLLVLLVLLGGVFLDPSQVEGFIREQAGSLIGPDAQEQIMTMVQNASERVSGGFSLSLVLSLAALAFSATGAFAQLQEALNTAWEVEPDPERSGLKQFAMKRVLSFGMILTVGFILVVSLALSAVISALGGGLTQILPNALGPAVSWAIDIGISLLVITALFAAILKVLPDAEISWRDVGVGAFVTALLFVVGKFAMGFYLGRSSPGDTFGQAGALAIILVWVYYSSIIFLLGAEFTQVWAHERGSGIQPDDDAVRVVEKTRHVRDGEEGRGESEAAEASSEKEPRADASARESLHRKIRESERQPDAHAERRPTPSPLSDEERVRIYPNDSKQA